jgi:hypothetical protein
MPEVRRGHFVGVAAAVAVLEYLDVYGAGVRCDLHARIFDNTVRRANIVAIWVGTRVRRSRAA